MTEIRDLVMDKDCAERQYYDNFYRSKPLPKITIKKCERFWNNRINVARPVILKKLGDISDKKILLVGNGASMMELFLLTKGAHLIYSDLSLEGLKLAQRVVENSEFKAYADRLEFIAFDATKKLPFPDNSLDAIFGSMFVHHLSEEQKSTFLSECCRCLKKDGLCLFNDTAYSPVWQKMKVGPLNHVRLWFYKTRGNSPEDIKASQEGGFEKTQILGWKESCGFRDYLFERHSFFLWIGNRLGAWIFFRKKNFVCDCISYFAYFLDQLFVEYNPLMRDHMINLIWGFKK